MSSAKRKNNCELSKDKFYKAIKHGAAGGMVAAKVLIGTKGIKGAFFSIPESQHKSLLEIFFPQLDALSPSASTGVIAAVVASLYFGSQYAGPAIDYACKYAE